jgi:hypothetical protein
MDHAMPDAHEMIRTKMAFRPGDQMFEDRLEMLILGGPTLFCEHFANWILGDKMLLRALDLRQAMRDEIQGTIGIDLKQREFDARRACVECQDCIGHIQILTAVYAVSPVDARPATTADSDACLIGSGGMHEIDRILQHEIIPLSSSVDEPISSPPHWTDRLA